MRAVGSWCAVVVVLSLSAVNVRAQEDLPSGQEVVDRYVEVTGGKDKYEAVRTIRMEGKMRIPQTGSDGTIEIYFAAPDKVLLKVDLAGIGQIEKGRNGDVAWEVNPFAPTGARILEAEESQRLLESFNQKAVYDPAAIYEAIENEGIEEVDGERCYKVAMKRRGSDDVDYIYFQVDTGLAVKSVTKEPVPGGKITVETTLSDYKEVDGIKSPHTLVQKFTDLGMTQEVRLDSMQVNEEIDDSVFEIPEAVEKLRE